MPTPAFQFTIPAPHAASFTDGELAVAVASPMASTPARTNYRLAKWFDFEGGSYTLKLVGDDSVALYVSGPNFASRFITTQVVSQGVVTGVVFLPKGRYRLDVVLANLATSAATTFFAMNLSKNGRLIYTSQASGWVFDTISIPDAAVPALGDPRLALPVLSVLPNWRNGIMERVEFKTEVLASENDTEQRRSLRRYPRRTFEMEFLRSGAGRSRLQAFFSGLGNNEFLVPLWHEQYKLQDTFGLTIAFPADSVAYREFQPGTLAMLIDKKADVYDIVGVSAINTITDTVTFEIVTAIAHSWPAGSRIVPLRKARILDTAGIDNLTDRVAAPQIRVTITEPDKWVIPSWLYCVPLFLFRPNRAQPIVNTFNRATTIVDNDSGRIESFDASEQTRVTMRANYMLRGRQQVYGFRQFIAQARGRQVKFWMPSQTQDLQPAADMVGSFFDVERAGWARYFAEVQEITRCIMVVFKNGRPPLFRFVTTIAEIGGFERVFVDTALPSITLADVERVSFVLPSRFDQEAFELNHVVDNCAVVTTGVTTRSDIVGDLPPIECVVTSRPYPVEEIEGLDLGMSIVGMTEIVFGYPDEAIDLAMTISAGLIDELLINYGNYADEAIDLAMTITEVLEIAGPTFLSYNNYADEAIDLAMTISAGLIDELLINYGNYADEAIDLAMTITSGEIL